jgi:hypothetical protein
MPIVTVGIMAAGAGLSMLSSSSANKAAKREAEARTQRAAAAAKTTREVNIGSQRAQAAQQREKVSRDTNLLLGQMVVSAAERNVLESASTGQGIQTILQGMTYNLSQINANLYMSEQQILAQTQYPEVYTAPQQNVLLSGLQGGLSGLSMGLNISGGLREMYPQTFGGMGGSASSAPQSGAWGGGTFSPSSGNIGGSGAFGVPSMAGGPNA